MTIVLDWNRGLDFFAIAGALFLLLGLAATFLAASPTKPGPGGFALTVATIIEIATIVALISNCAPTPRPNPAEALRSAEGCADIMQHFCLRLDECEGPDLESCLKETLPGCINVHGISHSEAAACVNAIDAMTCTEPLPNACLRIGSR